MIRLGYHRFLPLLLAVLPATAAPRGKADSPAFREALEGLPHVHVLRNNRKVWWGGFSSVDATIRLMREARSYSEQKYAGGGTALCNFTGA